MKFPFVCSLVWFQCLFLHHGFLAFRLGIVKVVPQFHHAWWWAAVIITSWWSMQVFYTARSGYFMLKYAAGLPMFDHLLGYSPSFPHSPLPPPETCAAWIMIRSRLALSPGSSLAFQCCMKHWKAGATPCTYKGSTKPKLMGVNENLCANGLNFLAVGELSTCLHSQPTQILACYCHMC